MVSTAQGLLPSVCSIDIVIIIRKCSIIFLFLSDYVFRCSHDISDITALVIMIMIIISLVGTKP